MRRHLLAVVAAVLALGFAASTVSAQCAFDTPKKAGGFKADLVQAFVSCGNPGGTTPNTTTGGGVPACVPPQTYKARDGSSAGWKWGPKGKGAIQIKKKKACTGKAQGTILPPCNIADTVLNPEGHADLEVAMKLGGIEDDAGAATGTGNLATVARATMNDFTTGLDLTIVDFPAGFSFDLVEGKAKMKSSANALLNSLSLTSLPACTSLEIVDINVIDEEGNVFARLGHWLGKK